MKRHTILRAGISACLLVLCQCATVSTAPIEQAEASRKFETLPDQGVVYVYRPGRAIGAAIQHLVKINGQDAGGTGPGSFFRWELPPGLYAISSSTSGSSATVQVQVESGRLYFLEQNAHLGLSHGGRVTIRQVDDATGKGAVSRSKLLVSSYIPE